MKNILKLRLISLLLIASLLLTSCVSNNQPKKVEGKNEKSAKVESEIKLEASKIIAEPGELSEGGAASAELTDAINKLASKSSSILLKDKKENTVYSPISLYYAIAMIREMADGETLNQLDDFLYADNIELTNQLKALMERQASKGDFKINNSYWVSDHIMKFVNEEYIKTLSDSFFAYVYSTDFNNDGAYSDIDAWADKKTNGMIKFDSKELFGNKQMVSLLINAVYFNSQWENEFNKERNFKDKFFNIDGSKSEAEYMNQQLEDATFTIDEKYEAAEMRLKNGSMHFILPKEGIDIENLLNEKFFDEYLNKDRQNGQLSIELPKFEIETSFEKLLQSLDLDGIIGTNSQADLSKGYKEGFEEDKVSAIIQKVKIIVNEKGAEAAAITADEKTEEAEPNKNKLFLKLNRPFIYLITLNSGEIIFTGTVVSFN